MAHGKTTDFICELKSEPHEKKFSYTKLFSLQYLGLSRFKDISPILIPPSCFAHNHARSNSVQILASHREHTQVKRIGVASSRKFSWPGP